MLSRLAEECTKCKFKDICNEKRLEALAELEPEKSKVALVGMASPIMHTINLINSGIITNNIIVGEITPDIADKVSKMNAEKAVLDDFMNKNFGFN